MTLLRPQKRIRLSEDGVDGRDRLSELPDDVIVRILSCMPIVDAVRTVLLRRFGNLWTWIHTLVFDMSEYLNNFSLEERNRDQTRWFCRFVRNVLNLHQNLCIDRFHVCIDFDSFYERRMFFPDISMWSRFALCRQAKEISISDKYSEDFCCSSILPNFTSQFLVTLELEFCKFEGEFQVELGSLKKLSLNRVSMTDEIFQRFISGCPSLQELVISNPFRMKELRLSAPNIDKLSLVLTENRQRANSLSLYFPNLKNLYLEVKKWQLDIIDVSSVRNIYIRYLNFFTDSDDVVLTINQVLVGKFEGIEVFRLSREPSKEFLLSIRKLKLLHCKWKRIILELHNFCRSSLLGIYHLMKSLPDLEELVIYTTEDFKSDGNFLGVYLCSPYVTPQLKTITLHGYRKSWKSQLQLVELLLKSAAALEKLIIVHIDHRLEEEEQRKFVKHVSSFPWASSTASVLY